MLKAVSLISLALVLSGCAAMIGRTVQITTPFFPEETKAKMAPGTNKVIGSALIRQQGGGVVTCAGIEVVLIPVTAYSTERMQHLYGSDQRGVNSGGPGSVRGFDQTPAAYLELMHKTLCDAQGMFEFADVGDGEYFVTTQVSWRVGYNLQGGNLMQRVKVSGGETKKIVLTA